jgi:hypothetical protein
MATQLRHPDVRCSRCNRVWSALAWRALPMQRTLTQVEVAAYVHPWPANSTVEVRACSGCGADIARRVHVSA